MLTLITANASSFLLVVASLLAAWGVVWDLGRNTYWDGGDR